MSDSTVRETHPRDRIVAKHPIPRRTARTAKACRNKQSNNPNESHIRTRLPLAVRLPPSQANSPATHQALPARVRHPALQRTANLTLIIQVRGKEEKQVVQHTLRGGPLVVR